MRRTVYLSSAQDDLADILRYLTRESASLAVGSEFIGKLRQRCKHLASLPGTLGTPRPELAEDLRSAPYQGYVIFFRYTAEALEIVSVLHAGRDVLAHFDKD